MRAHGTCTDTQTVNATTDTVDTVKGMVMSIGMECGSCLGWNSLDNELVCSVRFVSFCCLGGNLRATTATTYTYTAVLYESKEEPEGFGFW